MSIVDLYVDVENEFYVMWDDDEDSYMLTNLVTDSKRAISQGEFVDLRDTMRHYSISEDRVEDVLVGARRGIAGNLPSYYTQGYWDNYSGDV